MHGVPAHRTGNPVRGEAALNGPDEEWNREGAIATAGFCTSLTPRLIAFGFLMEMLFPF